jgi:hypothetical protein
MNETEERAGFAVEEVEWHWLRPHQERGAVIVVAPALELAAAAGRIADDDAAAVKGWIAAGLLTKPGLEQIAAWNAEPGKRFRLLIVQPYVLIQDLPADAATKE